MGKTEARVRPRKTVKEHLRKFKTNQVVIGNSRIARIDDTDVGNPQLDLLLQLFLKKKLLGRYSKTLKRQLAENLPLLVGSGYPEVNFEIHLFLSTIVTNYVCSWYTKLGTDNYDFVEEVYSTLCFVTRDLMMRIEHALRGDKSLFLIDDLATILDRHLRETHLEGGEFYFLREAKFQQQNVHRVTKPLTNQEIVEQYLASQHAIFDPHTRPLDTQDQSSDIRILYFRVLAHKLLETTFARSKGKNPLSSEIVRSFVVNLMGDFVLEKLFMKLSSPSFVLQTVVAKVVEVTSEQEKTGSPVSWSGKIQQAYSSFMLFIYAAKMKKQEVLNTEVRGQSWSPFKSPVFSLLNTLTGFPNRLPNLFFVMCMFQTFITSLGVVTAKLNTFVSSYILKWVSSSWVLEDKNLAANLMNLRKLLFEQDNAEQSNQIHLRQELGELLFKNFKALLSNLGCSAEWLSYKEESELDAIASIVNTLSQFEGSCICNDGPDESKLNQLLIIQALDLIIARLYPELVKPTGV
uniref:PXA domain-containing protein n=1 Tax=Candidozyma auris TaxID=498019 RepID=A0A0L0P002_CANAR